MEWNKCIVCGHQEEPGEVFHMEAGTGNMRCLNCVAYPHELKDRVQIITVAEQHIVNVTYAVLTDENGDYDDNDRVFLGREEQGSFDSHEIKMENPEDLNVNDPRQRAIREIKCGRNDKAGHLLKR